MAEPPIPQSQNRTLIHLFLAALALFGTVVVLFRVYHGVNVCCDPIYYIALSRAFAEGEGIVWLLGHMPHLVWDGYSHWVNPPEIPLARSALWPPLYPILLSGAGGFTFDAKDYIGVFNAVAYGLSVFVAGQWILFHVRSKFIAALGCIAVAVAVIPPFWASWGYTEPTFILFTTLALLFIERFFTSKKRSFLVWAAVFTALACMTRYSGGVLFLVIVPLIVLQRGSDLIEKLRRVVLYMLIAAPPLAMWLLRNYLVTDTLTGPRGEWTWNVGAIVYSAGIGLSSMEAWNPLMADIRALLLPMDVITGRIIGAAITGLILLPLAALTIRGFWHWLSEDGRAPKLARLTIPGAYGFVHIAFTIATAPSGYFTTDSRQFIPAYIPLVVVVTIASYALLHNRDKLALPAWLRGAPAVGSLLRRWVRILPAAVLVALVICVAYAGLVNVRDTYDAFVNYEFRWYSRGHHGEYVSIETTSVTEYMENLVGDARPIVRSHFDLYIEDDTLIYFKDECAQEDFDRRVRLAVEPANKLVLNGFRKNFGKDALDFFPETQGIMSKGKCLMISPLPVYDIRRITTGQREDRDNVFWEVSFTPLSRTET